MKTLRFLTLVLILQLFLARVLADTVPIPMQAVQGNGKPLKQISIHTEKGDNKAWMISDKNSNLAFRPIRSVSFSSNSMLYLAVTYLDDCYGRIRILYNGKNGNNTSPDRVYRGNAVKTGQIVTAMFRLTGILPEGEGNQPSIRIGIERLRGDGLSILNVSIQNQPFDNQQFKYIISSPWKAPYTGVTKKPLDNTTLKGKVMVGYQGWFRTPNDPEGRGWVHWGDMQNGMFSTDMWPDISQYPEHVLEKAADVKLLSGKPGYLFSSAWPEVAEVHFKWMREHDIDGAFLQRFVSDRFCSISGGNEWVLANVRAAANKEGRIWAIEYDVSGYPDAKLLETLKKDWKWMIDTLKIGSDPNYARENGKLVVFIWGMPFTDRNISLATSNAVVDFFKNDPQYGGNYVIGGIPGDWRRMDTGWQDHFKHYDAVSPWMSTSYASDVADFAKTGITYYPHAKPGFSWSNLKHIPTGSKEAYTPRQGGKFYWNLLSAAAQAKIDRLFVGMFDEYDEGTAIMPMSDDVPPTPSRPGIAVQIFRNTKSQGRASNTLHSTIDFDVSSVTSFNGATTNGFSIRWAGQITPPTPGEYTFIIEGVDGDRARLMINDNRVLDTKEFGHGLTNSTKVMVKPGTNLLFRLDYTHFSGTGKVRLLWEGPGITRQLVPQSVYNDVWGRFINNEGNASDWYLKLTQYGKEMMLGKRPADSPMPEK